MLGLYRVQYYLIIQRQQWNGDGEENTYGMTVRAAVKMTWPIECDLHGAVDLKLLSLRQGLIKLAQGNLYSSYHIGLELAGLGQALVAEAQVVTVLDVFESRHEQLKHLVDSLLADPLRCCSGLLLSNGRRPIHFKRL